MIFPLCSFLIFVFLPSTYSTTHQTSNFQSTTPQTCSTELYDDDPESPLVPCSFLDARFVNCEDPAEIDNLGNNNTREVCPYYGSRDGKVAKINATCEVFPCIECSGPRRFKQEVKCVKYTGHYFLSTLLYSIFLGILGVDRFCLGYSAIAVGKLMTLGGLGVWWIVDIFLLLNGHLTPADDSQWMPYW